MIPYGKQNISEKDVQSVIEVLKSDFLTQGPKVEEFEKAVSDYVGVKYAVAVSSATAALHIAYLSVGLEKGDLAWTSPNTFVASSNAALYCGAGIDFVDIDPLTYNFSVEKFEAKLKIAATQGKLPKLIIPVHFSGQSSDMAAIRNLAKQYDIYVIEDASHAIGGKYKGKPIGSCEFSDLVVFSFHPVKIITTGEGGMVLTNNREFYERLLLLRSHGITRSPNLMTEPSHGPWYYQQIELGYNYRITDLQAALGISQLKRIDIFIQKRHEIAKKYNELLKNLPVILPFQNSDTFSSYHLYVIRLKLSEISISHRDAFERLRQNGIGVQLHYIPVHTQPYYRNLGFKDGDFPESEQYYREAISLPMYYDLSLEDQMTVVKKLKDILT